MSFERARTVADAVLLEGYVLYPYRVSSNKNRFRWAFGVLAPERWSEAGGCEASWLECQCLVESDGEPRVNGQLRFLQGRRRQVEDAARDGSFREVETLDVDGHLYVPWDEGEVREIELYDLLRDASERRPFVVPGSSETELVRDASGATRGRIHRRCWPIEGVVTVSSERVPAERPLHRLRLRVDNTTPWDDTGAPRDEVLRRALIATHLLLSVENGRFLSLLDPPAWAAEHAGACVNERTYPVLVGPDDRDDLILSAPIILYDHPRIAPESHGDFFDATEIDELLTLRTMTLTDDEKREARATDERARALVDRVDALPPEVLERLHGAVRELRGAEMAPRQELVAVGPGSRVRLRPGRRRTDAQDLLHRGCVATVEAVLRDVDDREYLAVTIDDDPAADLHRWYGRFHYYYLDEVEPLAAEERP